MHFTSCVTNTAEEYRLSVHPRGPAFSDDERETAPQTLSNSASLEVYRYQCVIKREYTMRIQAATLFNEIILSLTL